MPKLVSAVSTSQHQHLVTIAADHNNMVATDVAKSTFNFDLMPRVDVAAQLIDCGCSIPRKEVSLLYFHRQIETQALSKPLKLGIVVMNCH